MKISVIVSAYNVEKYINKCISSVLNQTLKNIEVIVVNDGSTDNTLNILNSFKDKRLKIINQSNCGLPCTRSVGITKATGEYIFFLDADDWLEKNALEKLYECAVEKSADIAVCDFFAVLREKKLRKGVMSNKSAFMAKEFLELMFEKEAEWCFWNKLYSKNILNVSIPKGITYGEDLLNVSKITKNAKKVAYIPLPLVNYRYNPQSITKNRRSLKIYQLFVAIKCLEKNLKHSKELLKHLNGLKITAIGEFVALRPYFDSNNYQKGVKYCVKMLKEIRVKDILNYPLHPFKKAELLFLKLLPHQMTCKMVIVFNYAAKRFLKRKIV